MSQGERYHGLDAIRGGAMLLGVFLHATLLYSEPWLFAEIMPQASVEPPDKPNWVALLTLWIHMWRMPLFMILAGFFAQMVLERRGAQGFLADRTLRVLGTCLLFMTLFTALTTSPFGKLDHLWFLWWLAWFCALSALWHWIGLRPPALRLDQRWVWGLLVGLSVVLTVLGREEGLRAHIPETITTPDWRSFLYHYALFLLGQSLWSGRDSLVHLARRRTWMRLLGFATLAFVLLTAVIVIVEANPAVEHSQGPVILAVAATAGPMMLFYCLGFIGLAQAKIKQTSRSSRLMARLAFPIYVFHLYPALMIAAVMHQAGFGPLVSVLGATLGATGISCAIYAVIWPTPLDWFFTGPRKAWWRWPLPKREKPPQGAAF